MKRSARQTVVMRGASCLSHRHVFLVGPFGGRIGETLITEVLDTVGIA